MKQLVILAGGKGTRLKERLHGLPKPLVDICGVPLLERQVLLAKRHGFTHVLVLVSHAAQYILDFCASRNNWGVDLRCIDDGEPRGTAGACLAVLDQLADEFLVMYGDTMLNVDLDRFHAVHAACPDAVATLFLHPNDHPHDSDLVEIDDAGRLTAFHPYPHPPGVYYANLVNAGLYWVRRSGLEVFCGREGMLDFGKDLFPEILAYGQGLRAYISTEYIKDCGTPSRLDKVSADYLSGRIERACIDRPQQAVFLDRDGTLNREVGHLARAEQLELLPGVAAAVRRLNRSDYRSVVITNQPVLARGDCGIEEMRHIHARLETLLGVEGAYLDRIYTCPHHPERGFVGEVPELKIDCLCRKPKPGMVATACRELNIDPARSWLVGDTLVDVATAHAVGLRAVLVETGYAGMDYRATGRPDYTVPDLQAAVDLILDGHARMLALAAQLTINVASGDVILVGGLARSGKSNFASTLAESLRMRGLGVALLGLDSWLRDEADRQPGVLGRYDLSAAECLLAQRAKGAPNISVELAGYDKLRRQRIATEQTMEIHATDVIIIEGTVALRLAVENHLAHRLHVEIDERKRHQRVLAEYQRRGLDGDAAQAIYKERLKDETPVIEAVAKNAIRVVVPLGERETKL